MTKYSDVKNRALQIRNLKAKLDALSTKLDKEKKINKPLFRNVKNLIYSNTRLPKLEETLVKLNEISSQDVKTKLTKKAFKAITEKKKI
jgi:hypothetical protein